MSSPAQNLHHRRLEKLYPAVAGLVGIVISVLIWQFRLRFPFDDVFITFRYAEHVAAGLGFVWNVGGPPTEGYTNFLYVLLLAGIRSVTSDLLVAAQIVGVVSTIITSILLYRIGSKAYSVETGLLAAAFFLFTPLTWVNALSGMETSLFVMFITLAVLWAVRDRLFLSFGAAFLATLTRPEGALIGLIILVAIAMVSKPPFERSNLKKVIRAFVIAFVLPGIVYAIWKYCYFGEWLPNSFYVKVLSNPHSLLPGLQYVRLFFVSMLVLLVLTLAIRKWHEKAVLIPVLWVVALLAFYLFVLPLEGLYDRYLWPVFTMLCITAAIGTHALAQRMHLRSLIVPTVLMTVVQIMLSVFSPRTQQALAAHEEVWDASMDPIVRVLRTLPHSDSLQFAYGDAGYVVYKSDVHHIDLFGLNDTRIAHAHTIAERGEILRAEQPDIMLLPVYSRDTGGWVEDAYGLARSPSFEAVATTEAFPYPLVWLLNVNSPFYIDCKREFLRQLNEKGNGMLPAPVMRY